MAGGEGRGQAEASELDALPVADVLVGCDRLVGIVVAVGEVAPPAPLHLRAIRLAGDEARSGPALQLGESPAMVVVGVAVEEQLHVGEVEAERLDVPFQPGEHLHRTGVEQHVPHRGGQEKRADPVRPDVVHVAQQPERLDRLHPLGPQGPQVLGRGRLRRRLPAIGHDAPAALTGLEGEPLLAPNARRLHREHDRGLRGVRLERLDLPHASRLVRRDSGGAGRERLRRDTHPLRPALLQDARSAEDVLQLLRRPERVGPEVALDDVAHLGLASRRLRGHRQTRQSQGKEQRRGEPRAPLENAHAGATARKGNEISSQPGCPGMDISRFGPCRAWPSRAIHFRSVR